MAWWLSRGAVPRSRQPQLHATVCRKTPALTIRSPLSHTPTGVFLASSSPLRTLLNQQFHQPTPRQTGSINQRGWLMSKCLLRSLSSTPAILLTLLCCRQAAAAAQQPGHVESGAAHPGDGSGGHGCVRHQRAAAGCGESLADNRQLVIATEHSSLQQCWAA